MHKLENPLEDDPAKAKKVDKKIKLYYLELHDYNVSHLMGTLWRNDNRYNFQILNSIREAYANAFDVDEDKVLNLIYDECITCLSACRNIIVHNASFADKQFIEQVDGIELLSNISVGDKLKLNGDLVRKISTESLRVIRELIIAVDSWISDH